MNAGQLQRAIDDCTQFLFRRGALHPFAVDEQSWCRVNLQLVAFSDGGFHGSRVLLLDAVLQLRRIHKKFVANPESQLVECRGRFGLAGAVTVDPLLVAVHLVGKFPISIVVLRRQAVGIHRRVDRPRMDFV